MMILKFDGKTTYIASGSTRIERFELNEGDRFKVEVTHDGNDKTLTIFNLTTGKQYCCHNEEIAIVMMVLQFILTDSQEVE